MVYSLLSEYRKEVLFFVAESLMNRIPDWWVIHDEKARNNPDYIASMHPGKGGKDVVKLLWSVLARTSEVFEIGVGPWMNAIYLAQNGHSVVAQDVSLVMGENFKKHVWENGLDIPLVICPAQDYTPEKMYDAFVCTTVLHFMPPEDAIKTIGMMQKYTNPWGYNALEVFTADSSYTREDRFFPCSEKFLDLYAEWVLIQQKISNVLADNGSHQMTKFSVLFQKPL